MALIVAQAGNDNGIGSSGDMRFGIETRRSQGQNDQVWLKRALRTTGTAFGFRRVIQTSFIERVNLTFRQCIAALGRQTWSLLSEQQLLYHAEWFRLYYHLARPHESLREPLPGLKGRYRDRTPAMALVITDRVLTVGDILRTPLWGSAAWFALPGAPQPGRLSKADGANPSI